MLVCLLTVTLLQLSTRVQLDVSRQPRPPLGVLGYKSLIQLLVPSQPIGNRPKHHRENERASS